MSEVLVRPYRPADAEAVRRISFETALYGQPMEPLFQGRPLISETLIGYYAQFEPEALFVAELEGRVIGYLTGCLDTRRFERLFARRILPRLVWICLREGYWLKPSFWWLVGAGGKSAGRWSRVRDRVLLRYPAHCHMNLESGSRHAGTGSALLKAFFDAMKARGVRGIHILSATEAGKAFFTKSGFVRLAKYPAPRLPGTTRRETWVMGKEL